MHNKIITIRPVLAECLVKKYSICRHFQGIPKFGYIYFPYTLINNAFTEKSQALFIRQEYPSLSMIKNHTFAAIPTTVIYYGKEICTNAGQTTGKHH